MGERVFTMDLTPVGHMSKVMLDGEDISSLLRGVRVTAGVGDATTVELIPRPGSRVSLVARVTEAQIVIAEEA